MPHRLFTAWSNVTKERTPEFACENEHEAIALSAKYLNCQRDDVAIAFHEADAWTDERRIAAAMDNLQNKLLR